jgi:hypothetical protein
MFVGSQGRGDAVGGQGRGRCSRRPGEGGDAADGQGRGRCGRQGGEERLSGGLGFDGFYMLRLWAFVGWIKSGLAKTI